jgi:hypothetical protein
MPAYVSLQSEKKEQVALLNCRALTTDEKDQV